VDIYFIYQQMDIGIKTVEKKVFCLVKKPLIEQEKIFLKKLDEYQGKEETNDDVTIVGFKI